VIDTGCGKGGDLHKWTKNRPKVFVGLDASVQSIDEAKNRFAAIASRGRTNMSASFHVCDMRNMNFPVENESVDIVSTQFALQFVFDNQHSVDHFFGEIVRTLKPSGLFIAIFPDGNQIAKTLSDDKRFGHFHLGTFRHTMQMLQQSDPPLGIPYTFKFSEDAESCAEWAVSPSYLSTLLEQSGFVPEFETGFTMSAPNFFTKHANMHDVSAIMKTYRASYYDWYSLGFFRVCIARKG
jgi:mRNA (guanine-N7-)-methyltransferase